MMSYKKAGWFFACLSFLLVSGAVFADAMHVIPYREAKVIKSSSSIHQNIEIPLASIRRSGRGWEPKSILRVNGEQRFALYKINRNVAFNDVVSYYKAQLLKKGRRVLFHCEGRDCGSSNAWANDFFQDYLLYGANESQWLISLQYDRNTYQVVYITRRGSGDIMIRIEDVLTSSLDKANFDVVAQFKIDDVPRIRRFLNELPSNHDVIGYVTSSRQVDLSALERGDRYIALLNANIGERLQPKVRFVNLSDMGRSSLGLDLVSFVYVSH